MAPHSDGNALTPPQGNVKHMGSMPEILFRVLNFSSRKWIIQHSTRMLLTVKPFGFLLFISGGWHFSLKFLRVPIGGSSSRMYFLLGAVTVSFILQSFLGEEGGEGNRLDKTHLTDPTNRKGPETPKAWRSPLREHSNHFPPAVHWEMLAWKRKEVSAFN